MRNDFPTPAVAERGAQPYVGIQQTVTMQTIGRVADCIPQIFAALAQRGIAPSGAPFLRYHVIDMPRRLQVEAGVPITEPITDSTADELVSGLLPAGRYAMLTHHGPFDQLTAATEGLLSWAHDQGLHWDASHDDDGEHWASRLEIYNTNPAEEPDPRNWETVLAFKLAD